MATTIGADPEFFIRDSRTGQVVPIIGLLGGTKARPLELDIGTDYACQEDNVMAEFNIPATTNYGRFARSIGYAMDSVMDLVRTKFPEAELDFGCSRVFTHDMLQSRQARQFGCSPDLNAHKQGAFAESVKPIQLETVIGQWRFAGGHVHIGYDDTDVPPFAVAAFADLCLGLPSVALDKQGERRQYYGTAGRYREKPYGIEYRVLSNFWIFDRGLTEQVGYRAMRVGHLLSEYDAATLTQWYNEIPWRDVERAINTEDERLASSLLTFVQQDLGCPVG